MSAGKRWPHKPHRAWQIVLFCTSFLINASGGKDWMNVFRLGGSPEYRRISVSHECSARHTCCESTCCCSLYELSGLPINERVEMKEQLVGHDSTPFPSIFSESGSLCCDPVTIWIALNNNLLSAASSTNLVCLVVCVSNCIGSLSGSEVPYT